MNISAVAKVAKVSTATVSRKIDGSTSVQPASLLSHQPDADIDAAGREHVVKPTLICRPSTAHVAIG